MSLSLVKCPNCKRFFLSTGPKETYCRKSCYKEQLNTGSHDLDDIHSIVISKTNHKPKHTRKAKSQKPRVRKKAKNSYIVLRGRKLYPREYDAWRNMIYRCYNEKDGGYVRYGAKGIRVCDSWLDSFEAFIKDMGPKPDNDLTLDRIDNYKDYEPGNCRWVYRLEQRLNQRRMKR